MKYYDLTNQEKKIIEDFEKNEFISVDKLSTEKKHYQLYAKETLNKRTNINIRLSQKVLQRLKGKAAERGIPYQTLASSILHRFAVN